MRGIDLGERWAYHALHDAGHLATGLGERAREVYRDAELIINLHGGTEPRPERYENGVRLYVPDRPGSSCRSSCTTCPGPATSFSSRTPRSSPSRRTRASGLHLPVSPEFDFRPTRQPVVATSGPV
jgi:hypothetical protein